MPSNKNTAQATPIIEDILDLEDDLAALKKRRKKLQRKVGWLHSATNKTFLYLILGPRLSNSLAGLLHAAKTGNEPILGPQLARVLDAASRRMTGYKRWAVIFGLLAAIPSLVSLALVWQQSSIVKRETANTLADGKNRERLDLLLTLYSSVDKAPADALLTPSHAAGLRTEAALKLIELDTASYELAEKEHGEPFLWRVDISRAPLSRVNFSMRDDARRSLNKVSFIGSNMFRASFENCDLNNLWFDEATLPAANFRGASLVSCVFKDAAVFNTDFTGAKFEQCDFNGTKYNQHTQWPKGFDPAAAGAVFVKTP